MIARGIVGYAKLLVQPGEPPDALVAIGADHRPYCTPGATALTSDRARLELLAIERIL